MEAEMTLDKSFAELQSLSTGCWLKIGSGKESKIWENQLQFQVLATKSTIVINEGKINTWDSANQISYLAELLMTGHALWK